MSSTIDPDELEDTGEGHVNGSSGAVSTEDVRALLDREKANNERLQRELETERTGRNRAEQTASNQALARLEAEEQAVAARLESADTAAAGLRKGYSEALGEGRFDDAAELQEKMFELKAKQQQDRQYKTWLDSEKNRAASAPPPPQQPQQQGLDLANYTPGQRRWIRENPEFMTDVKLRQRTEAAHSLAVSEGCEVDSPEYFQVIDDVVHGERFRRDEPSRTREPPARRQREAPPAEIPVSRGTPARAERNREVKLTADEMEAADITNPDVPIQGHKDQQGNWVPGRYERYAINRAKMRARGQI